METLTELIEKHDVKLTVVERIEGNQEWGHPNNGFKCRLSVNGKSFTFPFYQGLGIKEDPEVKGVLECLLLDSSTPESLEYFCSEFDYDIDSKKAEKTHKACLKIKAKLEGLLGDNFETFLNCDKD